MNPTNKKSAVTLMCGFFPVKIYEVIVGKCYARVRPKSNVGLLLSVLQGNQLCRQNRLLPAVHINCVNNIIVLVMHAQNF